VRGDVTVLVVTGTGTGVGKTVVTAAIAALAVHSSLEVTVIKPAQTGVANQEPGDLASIARLVPGVRGVELARYREPLSPEAAARHSGRPALALADVVEAARSASLESDLVLIEGAGGLLVRLGPDGFTIADVAAELTAPMVLVTESGLGTLNTTALTLEALQLRRLTLLGVVIGRWPREPTIADRSNLDDLEAIALAPLAGALEAGAGSLAPDAFAKAARWGLGPLLRGSFDWDAFRAGFAL
jgi:dethiobiotin synthetase